MCFTFPFSIYSISVLSLSQASSVCFSIGTIIIFSVMQLYSPMLALLTQPGLYWLYGCISIVGVIFAQFVIIETKGKSVG